MPRRIKSDPIDDIEVRRRSKISSSLRTSEKQIAYHDRLRGVLKGPDTLKTRAAKSASHLAKRGSLEWDVLFEAALTSLTAQDDAHKKIMALQHA